MPPPEAVKKGKVEPLCDEDRRMIVRWIDLGCPIDLDPKYDPASPEKSNGYLADDQRPTLTLTHPTLGENAKLSRVLIGMHDYESGLDIESLNVTADFAVDGIAAGENLAGRFEALSGNRWEWKLGTPVEKLDSGNLTVSIQDRRGNVTTLERTFSIPVK